MKRKSKSLELFGELFSFLRDSSIAVGYRLPGYISPIDKAAQTKLARLSAKLFDKEPEIRVVDKIRDVRRSVAVTTGPLGSNVTARIIGYNFDDVSDFANVRVPYAFDIGSGPLEKVKKTRGEWSIVQVEKGKKKETNYVPEKGKFSIKTKEGKKTVERWKVDYGMIISNYSPVEELENKWSLVAAGCHGEGTLGCVEALYEKKILEKMKILNECRNFREFQAIIRVEIESYEKVKIFDQSEKMYKDFFVPKYRNFRVEDVVVLQSKLF